ncbi:MULTISPECIES: super-infection exclusion protein B [Amylolactobacillus]|uniref:Uncharacterized protein n=1 Tax=Amylolactobacillus amylophilus DSM 20533 = JCM 1125 TaxID=1423721 RepID=A0A1L6XCT5_9LACO|nr:MULTISPECIES: super-infection exclusion protein B [Amylolactobacillus]APT18780.1 hypothetical protein LA20533_05695 [Amylolactobacillus amylophilus DSM 20533 = JCM 1125]GED81031.1 transposase [Amylolactobacillus amylophilus]
MRGISEFLNLPRKIWGAIGIATISILILKPIAVKSLDGESFYAKFGIYVFILCIISWSILIVEILVYFYNYYSARREMIHKYNYVNSLEGEKLRIVRELYKDINHVKEYPHSNENIRELESNLVIGLAATTIQYNRFEYSPQNAPFPYLLQPWVIDGINNKKITL